MDFSLTKEQKEYISEVRKFSVENLNGNDEKDFFSESMWKLTSDFGILGITIGEEYGGMDESYLTAALMIEELGYSCNNNGFVFVINHHIWVSQNLIYLYGSDFLKEKYLPELVTGEKIGAFALTECDSGSDACSMKMTAKKVQGGYVLNGSKMFISNGTIADIFVLFALDEANPEKVISFVVEKEFAGLKIGKKIETLGLNSCPLSEVTLTDCFIPEENVLGTPDSGKMIFISALEWERIYEFAPHIGAMHRVIDSCMKYVNERKQFGQNIGEFQAVSHKIANMKIHFELSRNMLYKIAWMKDQGKNAFTDASIFKVFVSESYIQACRDALQIFGAYGYTKEYDIERELRDALACSIYSGTNEIQRNTIYRMMNLECSLR